MNEFQWLPDLGYPVRELQRSLAGHAVVINNEIDFSAAPTHFLSLSVSSTVTLNRPVNGRWYDIYIRGGQNLAWPSNVYWPHGIAPGPIDKALIRLLYDGYADIYIGYAQPAASQVPSCRVTLGSTNQTLTTSTANSLLLFNTEDWDNAGWWDTSAMRYTPQTPGKYRTTLTVLWTRSGGLSAAGTLLTRIRKNTIASNRGLDEVPAGINNVQRTTYDIISMNGSTDYIDFTVAFDGAGVVIIDGNVYYTYATIDFLGP